MVKILHKKILKRPKKETRKALFSLRNSPKIRTFMYGKANKRIDIEQILLGMWWYETRAGAILQAK